MAVQPIFVPKQQQQEKEEPDYIEMLAKGLQIANSGFGIAANYQNIQQAKQQRELNDYSIKEAKRKLNSQEAGIQDLPNLEKFTEVPLDTKGAVKIKTSTGYDSEDRPVIAERAYILKDLPKNGPKVSRVEFVNTKTGNKEYGLMDESTGKVTPTGIVAELSKTTSGSASGSPSKQDQPKQKPLNTEEVKRLDNILMGEKSIADMESALLAGNNTFSLIGDNDFTLARRNFEEAMGRMQSGGAISKDEEARFRAMAPRATDSSDIQIKKLTKLKEELQSRRSTLETRGLSESGSNVAGNSSLPSGIDPEEVKGAQDFVRKNSNSKDPKVQAQVEKTLAMLSSINQLPAPLMAGKRKTQTVVGK